MAEVMEGTKQVHVPSEGKVNAALTTGIIGTSLSGLMALGGLGKNLLGINCGCQPTSCEASCITNGDLYNERKEQADYVELTKRFYENQIENQKQIDRNFFDLYKMNINTSWGLYKNHVDDSFALYKGQRDQKDDLLAKIYDVEKKVDTMAAIRPYQDALINAKIDNVAMVGDFNLARRTCRMIQGELVLPSTPTVTGYPSYCCGNNNSASTGS